MSLDNVNVCKIVRGLVQLEVKYSVAIQANELEVSLRKGEVDALF